MIVSVDQQARTARLREADDFRHFHVEAASSAAAAEIDGIELAGEPESVWVSVDALRRWPGERSAEWDAGLEAMRRTAQSAGWLDPDGTSIRAHIERPT